MTRVRLAALLATATLVAAGCSDDEPRPRLDPTESASPTESPSTPEPTGSPSMEAISAVGTVRAWVTARNVTLATGDAAAVYALSAEACRTCRDLVEPFVELYATGGSMLTSGWTVDNAEERPDFKRSQQVIAALTFAGGETISKPGEDPKPFDSEKHILQFKLARSDGLWRVVDVVFLP